jgi:molybdate transport system ATP-binding protein
MTERVEAEASLLPGLRANVRKGFSGRHRFCLHADIQIGPGVTVLFGRSGAGKSTLLNCIAGIVEPDEGEIVLENVDERRLFDSEQRISVPPFRRKIGYVFQTLALFPHLTVRENVEYGVSYLPAEERRQKTIQALAFFRIELIAERMPDEISGGESQRVSLARALITEPAALLLDEPFSALDRAARRSILEDFRQWYSTRRIPILYVTHSRKEALNLSGKMLLMEAGRIIAAGEPESILAQAEELEE